MMGYVLPVQMDAYTQYANRINTSKELIKLDPINRPTFYRIDPQYSWEDIQKNSSNNLTKGKKVEKTAIHISSQMMAEITGKGRYVNEFI